ncbi:16S rRNA (guanine966-N2)-methyltransferase [Candidatus Kryptonium thompsonii]|uniref:16S rRNA (Guanine966-N2)-methyltransferase n=2 Tax=Candidatus Kryptonium thompsonii TaxID=1633631 RepID=A0A0P1LM04_9BACT|nr:16S rRNA (guanine(966)-N(2))-methyltransferase RsmD [Candidatus Kryptonium thompsoni]CUS82393.1 16S rRNA (guanine966-N2)-methyltransferase [Candidatus Kryptonium thompsoni]CUS82806.1 16S rRNA (guanine966-N2)-methyltransferase [Candidatus Kryptonium thompsoni]CUS88145.1 16S rRNA (guanine966-N2)-methyltransferase [Candidatus Kryptonium thompsoni]CUS90785.1 16S rRNA (guanine966-N2)-methyltransferase [Candidatus Kryptonium thompsoni]CUS94770.1 16S rRNA (guanine966-N2)-methyltransferase [Candida
MVRIITGKYKGRLLKLAKGNDIRPTSDRVKEALFNVLASRINFENLLVLDLFAGTGALGFEALSRGAEKVIFVDNHRGALRMIKENAQMLGCSEKVFVVNDDALNFIEYTNEKFDLIFADPPYMYPHIDKLVHKIWEKKLLSEIGFFSLEHDSGIVFTSETTPFEVETRRAFGKTAFTIFKYKE